MGMFLHALSKFSFDSSCQVLFCRGLIICFCVYLARKCEIRPEIAPRGVNQIHDGFDNQEPAPEALIQVNSRCPWGNFLLFLSNSLNSGLISLKTTACSSWTCFPLNSMVKYDISDKNHVIFVINPIFDKKSVTNLNRVLIYIMAICLAIPYLLISNKGARMLQREMLAGPTIAKPN